MELIMVSDSKIKIMLTVSDMTRYEITQDVLEMGNEHVRSAFREILNEVRSRTGFNATGNRLYVQYYPSKEGGCELFVTKLGRSAPNDGQPPTMALGKGVGLASPAIQTETGGNKRIAAYSFPSVSALLSACRRLSALPHEGESAAWRDEENSVYLFLYGMARPRTGFSDPYSFLSEYGTPQNADSLLLYIREHGQPICESQAVATLAGL